MWKVLVALGLFGIPAFALAAPYYEFAPDYSQPLTVQPGMTVAQVFAPLNDRLSVIELWVSTGGVPASLDVTLQNPSGTVVATRTVSLGSIADSTGGTRKSIILPAQLSVSGGEPYRLNITSTGASVKLYYSTSVSIAPGSGTGGSATYRYGTAIVDDQPQGYSFKFALTEAAETTVPVVSDVQLTQSAIGQALLSFTASEPVDVQVVYGSRTVGWTGQYTPCVAGITSCSVLLKVTPGTAYPYTATLKDAWGNTSTTQGSFTAVGVGPVESLEVQTATPSTIVPPQSPTPSPSVPVVTPGDTTPPVITNPRLISLTPTVATFAWTTNEIATSWVVIQVRPELRTWSYTLDSTFELEHYISRQGLPPDQYLRARITSTDPSGNFTIVNIDFLTPKEGEIGEGETPSVSPGTSATPTTSAQPSPSFSIVPDVSPSGSPTVTPPLPSEPVTTQSPASSVSPSVSATAVAYPSTSAGPGEIDWPPAGGGADGYRIDIFDAYGNIITTLYADAGATSVPLPDGLPKGVRIIVYADHDGAFEKVAAPFTVTDRPSAASPLLTPVLVFVGGGTLLVALIVTWVWHRRRQRVAVNAGVSLGLGGGPRV